MATAKSETADPPVTPGAADALSLPEMLRIMDVATAIRQDRELVEEQLNADEMRQRLREKLLAAAKVTGEEVTPEEVDAAIERYYSRLHTFREPPMGFQVALAHLYVRRVEVAAALVMSGMIWWFFFSPSGLLNFRGRHRRQVEAVATDVTRRAEAVRALARDPAVTPEVAGLTAEVETYRKQGDVDRLKGVDARLAELETRLGEEYTIRVSQKGKSGIDRYFKKAPAYYLIVEARTAGGDVLTRKVHNGENDRDEDVTAWGERVPKDVYDRLRKDKQEDGVLNETTYAVKRRGYRDEEVVMPGADGKPLVRLGQITAW